MGRDGKGWGGERTKGRGKGREGTPQIFFTWIDAFAEE